MSIWIVDMDRTLYLYSESNASDPDVLKFWEEEVNRYCRKHRRFEFTIEELEREYTVSDVFPSSCRPCVTLLKSQKRCVCMREDLKLNEVDMLQTLLSSVTLWAGWPTQGSEQLVSVSTVKDIAHAVVKGASALQDCERVVFVKASSASETAFTLLGLIHTAGHTTKADGMRDFLSNLSVDEADLVLAFLVKNRMAVLSEDGAIAKILPNSSGAATGSSSLLSYWGGLMAPAEKTANDAARMVTEADTAALQLRRSIHQVEGKVAALGNSIAALLDKARLCKSTGDTKQALVYLGMKRSREQARDKLLQSLVGLTEAQEAIGQCEVNVLLTRAYGAAAQGLKSSRKQAGLTADSAADAIESFQEEMEEMNQISDVISGGFAASDSPESQEQLEAELRELMAESEAEADGALAASRAQPGTDVEKELGTAKSWKGLPAAPSPEVPQSQANVPQRAQAKLTASF